MESKNNLSGIYHTLVATDREKVISVTTRDFEDSAAGLIHKFFKVPLSTDYRMVTHRKNTDENELHEVLDLFDNYQQYKEIEFLKSCLSYLRANKDTKSLTLTFHNN